MTPASKDLIAYFSMEIALASEIPTYSGGLGVLAGDTLRSAADMGLPMVAVTLLYRKGYFRQQLDAHGHQTERDVIWAPELYLERLPNEVQIHIQGRDLRIGREHAGPSQVAARHVGRLGGAGGFDAVALECRGDLGGRERPDGDLHAARGDGDRPRPDAIRWALALARFRPRAVWRRD